MTRRIQPVLLLLATLLTGCGGRLSQQAAPTPAPPAQPQAAPTQIGTACTAEIKANLGLYLNQGPALPVYTDATLKEAAEQIPGGGALLYYQADTTTGALQMEYVNSKTGCWTRGFVKLAAFEQQAHEARGASRQIQDAAVATTKATVQAVQLQAETALFDRAGQLVLSLPAGAWIGVRDGEAWESGASNHNLILIHAYSPTPAGTVWKVGGSKNEFWFVNLIDGKATPEGYKVQGL
ncbi:MAG TPA: hypothetical protein VK191_14380 [Symbiobacteriaceae bacterium]|nr:hypothetical protein [Symbiobacteriaceae bacterium]